MALLQNGCKNYDIVLYAQRSANLPWLQQGLTVLSVDSLEIYSSKIVAHLNRAAPRDLYDVHTMLQAGFFDESQETMLKNADSVLRILRNLSNLKPCS